MEKIKALSKLSNDQLSEKLSEEFPLELGPIDIEAKASFPISKHHVRSYVHENVLLAGDAAHTIDVPVRLSLCLLSLHHRCTSAAIHVLAIYAPVLSRPALAIDALDAGPLHALAA